ncbi:AAA family ATPase [Ideonella sp. BN130291]|uniref:AAA family ATPase n=1 Tax=Ideonella sp. BN130291 TaxID=3112940 RepID=UPI002E25D7BD|nr:AAA family ATPase [Ideonella sp. BN130291]
MTTGSWCITSWVTRTRASRIGRATRQPDGDRAILKVAAGDPALFREEYGLLRSLQAPGIVQPQQWTVTGALPAMVLPELDLVALDELLAGPPMAVDAALLVSHTLAQALAALHGAALWHGDLRPHNILVDRRTGAAWIADLSAAVERRNADPGVALPVDDWAWIAPEQTGRMDRPVDHRADLYVLGLLLYRMLAGRAPFEATDALEWAHCHTARPPAALPAGVPAGVGQLVSRLLAKTAEQRYRRAEGLLADIGHCIDEWHSRADVPPFALGTNDPDDQVEPTLRLHGREEERTRLLDAFAQTVADPRPRLVLVSGLPGVGKTSLVDSLHEPVLAAHGYFAGAKFDSQHRDVPYSALLQALHGLVRQVLAQPEAQLAQRRSAMADALGTNGQLMIDVVPALARIIGPQAPLPEVPPAEAQNRLRWVLGRFIGVLARAEHPLVLFLDDLQWADLASLALLGDLATRTDAGALLLVGAYRDDEVGAGHPLLATLERAQGGGARVLRLPLVALRPEHVEALVAESLHTTPSQARALAELVRQRTNGNPFFVLQFLAELRAEGLVRYDRARLGWTWDLERIRARNLADDVEHLVSRRLRRLPEPVRRVLQHAACLGTSGSVALLAAAVGQGQADVEDALAEAARAGMVACREGSFHFLHDRLQEAAYATIDAADLAQTHLRIGRQLLAALPEQEQQERIFELAYQLNRGSALVTAPAESLALARLNAKAGRKAKAQLAFASARDHLTRAADRWPAQAWDTVFQETFDLQFDLAECEFLNAAFQQADERLSALLPHAHTPAERARIYGLRIRLRLVPGQFGAAADTALEALRLFGVSFDGAGAPALVAQARQEVERELAGRSIEQLLKAPALADAEARTVLGLMVDSFTGIYIARPEVFPLLVLRATQLVLRHGNCEESAVVYTYYARVLLAAFGEIDAAYEYSQLAVQLNEKLGDRKRRGMLLFSHAGFIHFWRQPFPGGRATLDSGLAACLEVGNFVHAALIEVNTCLYMAEAGERLNELAAQAERSIAFLQATHSGGTLEVAQVFRQFARCLQGRTHAPGSFDDEHYRHDAVVQRMRDQNNVAGLGIVHMLEQMSAFVMGDTPAAREAAGRTAGVLRAVFAMPVRPTHVFYRALTLAEAHPGLAAPERPDNLRAIEQHAADLATWAEHCPENYANRHALVAAELARLQGQELQAERLYEQAIDAARASRLVHQEALACERAAAFHHGRGLARIADAYIADAHQAYMRWGALGKAAQLETTHPVLRIARSAALPIDTLAVMKAAQAVSSQIDLAALLDTLMRIALEQAGAQAARLYIATQEPMQLAASAEVHGEGLVVQQHADDAPVEGDHPLAILNFVRRSQEQVLLGDATQAHPFSADPWLGRRRPRSVLCLPLVRQSQTIGVLYLEHGMVTHAFTPRHATVLGLLAGQAAISLETARLYAALKAENAQRRLAEAATLEWQARIGRLVESNIIAVRIANLDGLIVDANDAYLRLVGYSRDDMAAGRLTTHVVTPPEYRDADARALEELLRDGRYVPYEKVYVRKDGSRVPVMSGGILFQGERPQTVGFVLDLSERDRAELAQRARLEAEAANQAKSAFLANMSHELRTPLNGVLGFAQLLQRDDSLTERQRRGLHTIEASGNHLLSLINDILDLARIEAGRMELAPVATDPRNCLDFVADVVRLRAEQKGVQFVLDTPPPQPASVLVDELRLRQVLLNLLSNSVKFTHAGRVTLRMRARREAAHAWALAFDVEDTGVGMTPAEVQRIFRPFEQAGSARQRAEGMGLGLAISDALVRQMGGTITVHSEPGKGSAFSFELLLPAAAAAMHAPAPPMISGYLGPRRRVLVVDDVHDNRQILLELLKSLDFDIAEAADGRQALEQARALRPDLVLIDNGMPKPTGSEVTRQLRAEEAFAQVPIIAVSAGASAQERERYLAAGANAFLAKPVDVPQLLNAIGHVLDLSWTRRGPPS